MIKPSLLCAGVLLAVAVSASASSPLGGFYYGNAAAPGGHEWQSPDSLAYNKEQPRATFHYFADAESARGVLPTNSKYWKSLDGTWKFRWVPEPSQRAVDFFKPSFDVSAWDNIPVPSNWNVVGLQKDGSQKYGKPIYVNQPVIFWHQVKPDDWRGGVMRTPPTDWTTYEHRNEVGAYRRSFTVPADWAGRQVYINFDGVDSFFYLWINGHYVGFSKNSRNAARFNITPFLQKGENVVAVEVYRSSDGSFLEAQDMFRLPGIFRSVSLYATAPQQVRDLVVIPDLTDNYTNGELNITADIRNLTRKEARDLWMDYTLYACDLYSDTNHEQPGAVASSGRISLAAGASAETHATLRLANPRKWSAEQPWRYVLVGQLKDKKGRVLETVSTYVGFRKVEVKDTPAEADEFGLAGRYFYVNGKPVKLKGVNRHETNPSVGHAITPEMMEREVMLMKRANINHVRNSHYPDAPYWYYLADKYGIYLEDEANLESHEYYYGKASLSHVPEWRNAHIARDMELVHSTVNHPAVVTWSLGNEAGPGDNFIASYNAIKEFDTSRPVQYERNNNIVDIGSNQYPSIAWTREAVKGKMGIKYPFHISEYAHSMGNAVGNLVDYWDAIESTNFLMGGAIWDWVDQSIYNYDAATGARYLGFGGDFGDNPSDGQFVMNGIMFGDLAPKPQYYEVKKVYQNVGITPADSTKPGNVRLFNKNYFAPLTDYTIGWTLLRNGVAVQQGTSDELISNPIAPRQSRTIQIPVDAQLLAAPGEYFLNIELRQTEPTPWAEKGYVQMAEQIALPATTGAAPASVGNAAAMPLSVDSTAQAITVRGANFEAVFSRASGALDALRFDGRDVIVPGHGPQLDAFRAYLNNDAWVFGPWFENGLYNLRHRATDARIYKDAAGNVVVSFAVESQAPRGGKMTGGNGNSRGEYAIDESASQPFGPDDFKFTTNQIWTITPAGTVELNAVVNSSNPTLILPRLGYSMQVPADLSTLTYYGRGPEENYADRKTGQFVGRYTSSPAKELTPYTRPQSNGNHEDVRWAALTDGTRGALFVAPEKMSFTAIPYSELQLFEANHPFRLSDSKATTVHLDLGVTGLGGASCGQGGPLEPDRVRAGEHRFSFIIIPTSQTEVDAKAARTAASGAKPLGISRSRSGQLSISYPGSDEILYTIDSERKPRIYTGPFEFKAGGRVHAWLKSNPNVNASAEFNKIETVKTTVLHTSSFEPGYGEGSNLTDGDASTIWHTMYSVTVAGYPHWVDFDAAEPKEIRGVRYLPRQDGSSTGTVKDYEIYVSDTPDQWGEPVAKGSFSGNKLQTVMFAKPVRGRYVRFMALNAQNGRDYASGAEFGVIANE